LMLDPCTGMELVDEVDTATWLACATELSQLSRKKTESDIYNVVFRRCRFEAVSVFWYGIG
uniref:Rab3 GTPase-activating protein catalytic subunit n=1 Tax=Echinostoma caproni TaxID=27848 RepID=A0A183BH68_9TREM